ncbi:MAG: hypothetical protein GY786_06905 [Proteobacteria bacterium]|nr:hypothetical protein [Pseudomonadota bacterium]
MSDLLVPIVFPDYKITLETPAVVVQVPDYLPFVDIFPDEIRVPHTLNKISDLGHAGVLVINGRTGVTKYYEYGRYDPTKLGWVKKIIGLANVKIDLDGNPTEDSFLKVLQIISRRAGKSGRISAAIIKVEKKYETIVKYAERRMMMNSDPNRENYNIMTSLFQSTLYLETETNIQLKRCCNFLNL